MLPVTSMFAIFLAALVQALGVLVIRRRRASRIAVGTGADDPLTRAVRAQGNLIEYGLVFALLLALAELNGAPWWWLTLLALAFAGGRVGHAYGLLVAEPKGALRPQSFRWRIRGMATTLTVLPLISITLLATLLLG